MSSDPLAEAAEFKRLQDLAKIFGAAFDEGDVEEAKRLMASWGSDRSKLLPLLDRVGVATRSIVHDAIRTQRMSFLRFMVEAGADINATGIAGPPLVFASAIGNVAAVKYLVEQGADMEVQSIGLKRTPLATAIAGSNTEIALYLIAAGARINDSLGFESQGGASVSMMAARYDLPEVYLALVRKGAMERSGTTPLARAMRHGVGGVVAACLADPVLRAPAEGVVLDERLLRGASDEAREVLLAWRTEYLVATGVDGVMSGAPAPAPAARSRREGSAPL